MRTEHTFVGPEIITTVSSDKIHETKRHVPGIEWFHAAEPSSVAVQKQVQYLTAEAEDVFKRLQQKRPFREVSKFRHFLSMSDSQPHHWLITTELGAVPQMHTKTGIHLGKFRFAISNINFALDCE